MPGSRKHLLFWPILLAVLGGDYATKQLAVAHLSPPYIPHEVLGDVVRLTLAFNQGAAMGLSLGIHSRWIFGLLAVIALAIILRFVRGTPGNAVARTVALALIAGGALGNLLDRIRSARGVVDFIDVGIGHLRFWTFNVADSAVTCGAILLALLLVREDRQEAKAAAHGPEASASGTATPE
jgi:signal peptidase II